MFRKRSSQHGCAEEKKPSSRPVQPKRLKTSLADLLKDQKDFYGIFMQIASALEASVKVSGIKAAKERRVKGDRRHFEQRIRDSSTFADRDKVLRDLAAFCYHEGQKFAGLGSSDMQIKWLKLLERFLRISNWLIENVRFEEELAELTRQVHVLKERADEPPFRLV